jgi:hypothetical protein
MNKAIQRFHPNGSINKSSLDQREAVLERKQDRKGEKANIRTTLTNSNSPYSSRMPHKKAPAESPFNRGF